MKPQEILGKNKYRIFLAILEIIVLYILSYRIIQLTLETTRTFFTIFLFFIINNLTLIKSFLLAFIILLLIYGLYKESATPMLASVVLGYSFQLIIIYIFYFQSSSANQTLYKLSLEMIFITITLSIIDNIKPYLRHKKMIQEKMKRKYHYFIPDLSIYVILLAVSIWVILYFTKIIYKIVKILTLNAPKEFNTLINNYIETNLGYLTIITFSFALIAYFIYNMVEPLVLYLTHSHGQARGILNGEYNKMISKERFFLYDVNRQLYIGLMVLLPVLIFPLVIFIYENPVQAYNYFVHILYDFSTFNYTVSRTSADSLLQIFTNAKIIEVYKEKLEELIRFFLYLLY